MNFKRILLAIIGESGQIQRDYLKATAVILARHDCGLDQIGSDGGGDK